MKPTILLLILLLGACGTETGNPSSKDPKPTSSLTDGQKMTSSYEILNLVCQKIELCFLVSHPTCINQTLSEDNFDESFGLETSLYSSLNQIIDAEAANELAIRSELAKDQCLEDIEDLTCSDAELINAFDSSDQSNFSKIYKAIPIGGGACQDIY